MPTASDKLLFNLKSTYYGKMTTVIATGVYLLSDVIICFRVFVSFCQAAFNLLDIFGRWQLLWIYAPADEHITDSCVIVNMFLLDNFGRMQSLVCVSHHSAQSDSRRNG